MKILDFGLAPGRAEASLGSVEAQPRGGVFDASDQADPLVSGKCGGPLKIIAYIIDELSITRILEHLCLTPPPPEKPPPIRELVRVPVDDEGPNFQAG